MALKSALTATRRRRDALQPPRETLTRGKGKHVGEVWRAKLAPLLEQWKQLTEMYPALTGGAEAEPPDDGDPIRGFARAGDKEVRPRVPRRFERSRSVGGAGLGFIRAP